MVRSCSESSLDEIKEIVRKRLELSSVSDFTLFYDTDISLENSIYSFLNPVTLSDLF
jgi:hypothetical protein